MKIGRLLETTIILLNRGKSTAKELAERFDVSTRTIYRDIEVLSAAGVPVYCTKGKQGGISLLEEYALNRTFLSPDESDNLLLALKTLEATRYPQADMIVHKMGALFQSPTDNDWIEIDFDDWSSFPNEQNKFNHIKLAIVDKKRLRFDYINANGEKSSRVVEPAKLMFKGKAWYLLAFCKTKNANRIFKISRIKQVELLPEHFTLSQTADKGDSQKQARLPSIVRLHLRFDQSVLYRLYDDFDEAFITKNSDSSVDVRVSFPEDEWVYGYILSFGSAVKVIAPHHVRETVIKRMKDALFLYSE